MAMTKEYNSYHFSDYFKTEIPSHWEEKQLGYLSKQERNAFVDGPFGSDLKTTDYQDSGIPLIQLNNIRDGKHVLQNIKFLTESKKKQLFRHVAYPKDIVIAKMAEPVARAAVVNESYPEYVIVADCVKMTPNTDVININYLIWAINSDCVRINAELVSTGTTRIRINLGELKKLKIPYPSISEQSIISSFLDHETAKIDNLIGKQQQLIELLKEKRQAVISHAVTKGLNLDVPMKDSGVEWLGLISGCCSLTKLKYLVFLKTVKLIDNNSQYVGMENISSGTGQFLTKDELIPEGASISFDCGDVLFGKLRPYLAKSWLATFSGVCSSEFLVFHTRVLHPKFLNYYLLTNEFIKQVDSSTYGSKMPRANWDFIGQLPVPTWSYEESEAIAAYLDSITFKLDNLLEKQYQQVRFLQERRTALISAAVTGKIDVRDWVAPDTSEVEESQEATA